MTSSEDVQRFVAGAMVEANPGVAKPEGHAVPAPSSPRRTAERQEHVPDEIRLGSWHWLTVEVPDKSCSCGDADCDSCGPRRRGEPLSSERLVCVTRIGSNYAKVETPDGHAWRVHLDEWDRETRPAPDHRAHVDGRLAEQKRKVAGLLEEVRVVTARLGMVPAAADQAGTALATLSGAPDVKDYRTALEKAKADELPALFEKIKAEHEVMATWMKADLLAIKALSGRAKDVLERIDGQIFNVELYAGLTEEIVQVRRGEPAPATERLRVFQNRIYADEECLLDYKHGGLEFGDMKAFDRWLAKPKNLDRILPFPRCMVALRVRRFEKDRSDDPYYAGDLGEFIKFNVAQSDKLTFLYVRNGERLYRMDCKLEFGDLIFPSRDEFTNEPQMFKKVGFDDEDGKVIFATVREYESWLERKAAAEVEREAWLKAHPFKKWSREAAAERLAKHEERWVKEEKDICEKLLKGNRGRAIPWTPETLEARMKNERDRFDKSYAHHLASKFSTYDHDRAAPRVPTIEGWKPFDKSSVCYDEALKDVTDRAKQWNRIALIIQGLFDRSDVLHPHPPVQSWTAQGFAAAIELIYDGEHVLHHGDPPDFEAYAAGLRERLGPGSFTIGQERLWMDREQAKEAARRANDWRIKWEQKSVPRWWTPGPEDQGPGFVAEVGARDWQPVARRAVFRWHRRKRRERVYRGEEATRIAESIQVEASRLFNVSAYAPGDYLRFFRDPRTRADYVKWAPLLLSAEDWHAGKLGGEES